MQVDGPRVEIGDALRLGGGVSKGRPSTVHLDAFLCAFYSDDAQGPQHAMRTPSTTLILKRRTRTLSLYGAPPPPPHLHPPPQTAGLSLPTPLQHLWARR